jgi:hypothetical protein
MGPWIIASFSIARALARLRSHTCQNDVKQHVYALLTDSGTTLESASLKCQGEQLYACGEQSMGCDSP